MRAAEGRKTMPQCNREPTTRQEGNEVALSTSFPSSHSGGAEPLLHLVELGEARWELGKHLGTWCPVAKPASNICRDRRFHLEAIILGEPTIEVRLDAIEVIQVRSVEQIERLVAATGLERLLGSHVTRAYGLDLLNGLGVVRGTGWPNWRRRAGRSGRGPGRTASGPGSGRGCWLG